LSAQRLHGRQAAVRVYLATKHRRFGGLTLAVLALHLLLLRGAHDAVVALPDAGSQPVRPTLQVRMLLHALAARDDAAEAPAAPGPGPARPVPPARPEPNFGRGAPAPAPEVSRLNDASPAEPPPPATAAADPLPEPEAAPLSGALPVYRTRPPPAFAFSYDLSRGAVSGLGGLQWQTQGDSYRAHLSANSGGAPLLAQESVGGFDEAGIAPTRHTDRRRGHRTQAANFRRDAGKVTISGPAVEYALPAGAQDRLSWMLQLAAVAAADPSLVGPGGRVSFLVIGARGDADVWTIVHVGAESLPLPDGDTPTVRLLREPGRAFNTRAEVWLDPARRYLPVRARLSNGSAADTLQFTLREVLSVP
jgi:hypothetical protein